MSGNVSPLLVVPLRNGTEAQLSATTLTVGGTDYSVARISVARQVSPEPVTIALLVAGAGMVEFQPARPDDGAIILEAIFRLRPDLRTPGFEPPVGMPPIAFLPGNMLPGQARGPAAEPVPGALGVPGIVAPPVGGSGFPSSGMQPVPHPYPPTFGAPTPYAPSPAPAQAVAQPADGRLTPFPRGAFALFGVALAIFGLRLPRWLTLAVLVALIPSVLGTAAYLLLEYALGIDPLQAVDMKNASDGSISVLQGGHVVALGTDTTRLLIYGSIAVGTYVLSQLFSVYQLSVLAAASRDALRGRAPRVGASLAAGARRFFPTLGASILVGLVMVLMSAAFVACLVLANLGLAQATTLANTASTATATSSSPIVVAGMIAGALLVPLLVLGVYLWGRLMLAPYVAATEQVGPGRAFGRGWRLTRRAWWHVMVPVTLALLTAMFFVLVFSAVPVGGMLGAQGLAAVLTALVTPLGAIVSTGVLYDLRLRTEGYNALMGEDRSPVESPAVRSEPPAIPR